jgi:hypothetical protein
MLQAQHPVSFVAGQEKRFVICRQMGENGRVTGKHST